MNSDLEQALSRRLLSMADDELILGHRNSEWAGHAPILEEDIAFANIAQDEMGHAAIWYKLYSELTGKSVDRLIFFRDAAQYRNCQLVELPKGDWGNTIVRQYLFDAYELARSSFLLESTSEKVAAAAQKIRPEELYHYRHSSSWIKRLGLGTKDSHDRIQSALNKLWPYSDQLFAPDDDEYLLVESGLFPESKPIEKQWLEVVGTLLGNSDLRIPLVNDPIDPSRRKHSSHLVGLLAEMQEVARLYPDAQW